jgi:hypothetical protein
LKLLFSLFFLLQLFFNLHHISGLVGKPVSRWLREIDFQNGPLEYEYDCSIYQQVGFVGEKELMWIGRYAERSGPNNNVWVLNGKDGIELNGNFELVFTKNIGKGKKNKRIGYTWLNTSLISETEELILDKASIDKFHKDRKHQKYSADLTVCMKFGQVIEHSNPMQESKTKKGESKN